MVSKYPRVFRAMPAVFRCEMAHVRPNGTVFLRDSINIRAYADLELTLEEIYVRGEKDASSPVRMNQLKAGLSVVVVWPWTAARAEVITFDPVNGFSQVYLIDTGEIMSAERERMFFPSPLLLTIPPLVRECTIHGVTGLNSSHLLYLLEDTCSGELTATLRGNNAAVVLHVSIMNDLMEDVGLIIRQTLRIDEPYDPGFPDEGYDCQIQPFEEFPEEEQQEILRQEAMDKQEPMEE